MAELYEGPHRQESCLCGHPLGDHDNMPTRREPGDPVEGEFTCRRCLHIADVRARTTGDLERYALKLTGQSNEFVASTDLDLSGAKIIGYEEGTFAIVASAYERMVEVKRLVGRVEWLQTKAGPRRANVLLSTDLQHPTPRLVAFAR